MTSQSEERVWQIPNQMKPAFARIYEILAWVDGLSIPEQTKYFVYAALEELLSNQIKYGNATSADHPITVQIVVDHKIIRIELADNGQEFDPTLQPAPDIAQRIKEGQVGGLGIELVRRICSHMSYRRESGHNHVTLLFNISGEPGGGIVGGLESADH